MQNKDFKNKYFYCFFKRCFDIVFSFLCILIFSWLLIILTILVPLTSKGGPFYVDHRLGKNKKEIKVLKFRTMNDDKRDLQEIFSPEVYQKFLKSYKLDHDPRVTKFGAVLRKLSLDELPQLFNILKGDMSFIGPRPIAQFEYNLLWNNNDLIFKVRPGLTGYWACSGRNDVEYEERIKLENYYVLNRSFLFDIKIFFKTIISVVSTKGAK